MSTPNLLPINDPKSKAAFATAVQQLRNFPVLGMVVETTLVEGRIVICGWRLAEAEEIADMALSLTVFTEPQAHNQPDATEPHQE